MSSGSLGSSIRNGLKTDTATMRGHRQQHGGRHRDAQHPHHPAVARRDRKARLHSGLIGWGLNRIHRCSEALAPSAHDPPEAPAEDQPRLMLDPWTDDRPLGTLPIYLISEMQPDRVRSRTAQIVKTLPRV